MSGRKGRKTNRTQLSWVVTAILSTIIIIVCSDQLSKFNLDHNSTGYAAEPDEDVLIWPESTGAAGGALDEGDNAEKGQGDQAKPKEDGNNTGDIKDEVNGGKEQDANQDSLSGEDTKKEPGNKEPDVTKTPDATKAPEDASDKENDENENSKKLIAFTFDDGPHGTVTDRILDVLEQNNAKATFFMMGNRVGSYPNTVKRVFELGSQIGNHTYSHKDLTKLDENGIIKEVVGSNDLIDEIVDVGDVALRPPYGNKNDLLYNTVKVPLILWSVDTRDWELKNKDKIVKEVLDTLQDGDIVLMHDLYESTAEAVEYLVPELIKQGYEFVTVSELLERRGVTVEPGKVYFRARPQ